MFEIKPYPEFSWSNSRQRMFKECKKKYYYHYYQSHNGWLYQSDGENKLAYRLKHLKNLPIALGEAIHEVIHTQLQAYLKGELLASEEQLQKKVREKLNKAFIDSKTNAKEWLLKPKRFQMLHEIYYHNELLQDDINTTKERITSCIRNLLSSTSYNEILTNENIQVIEAEELRTFSFDNVKVYVVPDFVYRDRQTNKWVIVDWKTGRESESDRDQLALYAIYLIEQYQVELNDIIIRNEYLVSGKTEEHTLTAADLVDAKNLIVHSTQTMKKMLAQPDLNQPLSKDKFVESYSYRCHSCNFKQNCDLSSVK